MNFKKINEKAVHHLEVLTDYSSTTYKLKVTGIDEARDLLSNEMAIREKLLTECLIKKGCRFEIVKVEYVVKQESRYTLN